MEVTVVLLGRTGSGKSTLGNKIMGSDFFAVGQSLDSQTSSTISKTFSLKELESAKIKIIDTPGFADNRVGKTTAELLSDILIFLKELENGFNVGIYCLPPKTRVDAHDIHEIQLLSLLLGDEVFKHTFIAVTLVDTLQKSEKLKVYEKYPIDLPMLLHKHNLKAFGPQKILFSDFGNFEEGFMKPFVQILKTTPSYIPKISKDINPHDPESIKRALAAPEMQEFMKKYESLLAAQKKEIEQMHGLIAKQQAENEQMVAENKEEQEMHKRRVASLNDQISKLGKGKEELEKEFRTYRNQESQKLKELSRNLKAQEEKSEYYEQTLREKDTQIRSISDQMRDLELAREAQKRTIVQEESDDDFVSFFKGLVKTVANFALNKLLF